MNMTTVPSNQLKAMQQEIADLKEQLAQLRIEADFNFEQYQDAGRLLCDLQAVTEQQAEAIRVKDATLEKIACIGNGDTHGNSIGNCLAIDALALQPSPEILQDRDERVAEACALMCHHEAHVMSAHGDSGVEGANWCGSQIRNGGWKEYL